MENEVDIVIIGAGVAGCTAAIALARSYSVVLVDQLSEPVERIGECLPPAGRRILKQLDLLEHFEQAVDMDESFRPLQNTGTQSWWGTEKVQVVDHLRNPDGFGWHLDRKAFEKYLRNNALQRGVTACWPAKLYSALYEKERWQVTATEGDQTYTFMAKFVIDASGRQSHFTKKTGIQRQQFDRLVACWAILPNGEENKLSTISSGENGWWYSAALPGNKRVLAFQTDSDLLERGGIKTAAQFVELANRDPQIFNLLQRNPGHIDYRGTVAANSTRLNEVAGPGWAALGDAALSFDPLSSQGMFNAMAGAMQLSELISETGIINNPVKAKQEQFQAVYTGQMNSIWEHYVKHKNIFYGQERRWKEREFWKRRQHI
jgi:flavin-dependent dehydrogenase